MKSIFFIAFIFLSCNKVDVLVQPTKNNECERNWQWGKWENDFPFDTTFHYTLGGNNL